MTTNLFLNRTRWLHSAFCTLILLFTLGIGNAWGADETLTITGASSGHNAPWTTKYGKSTGTASTSASTDISLSWTNVGRMQTGIQIKGGTSNGFYSTSCPETNNKIKSINITNKTNSGVLYCSTDGENWSKAISYTSGTAEDVSASNYKYFKVTATTGAYCVLTSIVVTYTAGCTGLEMSEVTATAGDRQIVLSWPAVANADSYTVTCKEKSSGDAAGTGTGSTTGTSCTITGLSNGTEYTWSVEPVGSGNYCDINTPATGDATPNVYYTVTWNNNGSQYTTTSVASGSRPVFPDAPSSCDGTSTTFYGWTASPWSGKLDDVSAKTIYTSGSAMPNVSGPVTYHAVFAKGTANTYKKGTKADLTDGQTVLIVNPSASVALKGDKSAQSVTITSNKITTESKAVLWTVEPHGSGYYFKYGSNYLNAGTSSIYVDNDADEWSVSESGPYILTSGNQSSKSLQYYNSSWKIYNTGNNSYFQMDFYIPDYSQYLTTCCTELGSINGSF